MALLPDLLPTPVQANSDLWHWYEIQQQIKHLQAQETLLRERMFRYFFLNPKEGTTTIELHGDYKLKGEFRLNRKLDEAALAARRSEFENHGISVDSVVRYKPDLVLSEYRKLPQKQRLLFEEVITTTPGLPGLYLIQG